MSSHKYRVSKETILNIAEHCDLETLSTLTQTSKDIHNLVADYEHSIAQAKIGVSQNPPQGLILSSEDEQRCTIPVRNSFATVQELDRRAHRCDSLLNRGAFLLTGEPEILNMTEESLDKFKAGLQHAFCVADQLADLATQFSAPSSPPLAQATIEVFTSALSVDPNNWRNRVTTVLRRAQIAHIRSLPSRSLAWLVTLAAGASKGYARYSARLLETDPAMADARVMAFKEVLLRHGGSLVVWAFMRGTGSLAMFVKHAVAQCAQEVLFFEMGGSIVFGDFTEDEDDYGVGADSGGQTRQPAGLHMSIMEELNRRIARRKKVEAEKKGEIWDEEDVETREVWDMVHVLVAQEIGCKSWKGYDAIKYPPHEEQDGA